MKKISLVFLMAISAMAFASDTREFDISSRADLDLANVSGDITLKVGSADRVVVSYVKKDDDIEVIFQQNGDRITVEVEYPQDRRKKRWNGGVHFTVEFPADGDLSLSSVSGDVDAEGVNGRIRLKSVSGNVELRNASGDVKTESVSGNVILSDMGEAELDAKSVSGNVKYAGDLTGGDYNFESVSGNVNLQVSDASSFRISGSTMSGSVRNNLGGDIQVKKAKYGPQTSINGSYNGGDVRVDVGSVSGSVTVSSN